MGAGGMGVTGDAGMAGGGGRLGGLGLSEALRTQVDKPFARVSWGAIIAGGMTAVSVLLVFSLLGVGIGLSSMGPVAADNPSGSAIGMGAALWWTASSIVALFLGGFVAGRMAGNLNGFLHGLVTWSAVTLMTAMLVGGAVGRVLAGASGLAQFAAQTMPAAVQGIQNQAPGAAAQLEGQAKAAIDQMQGVAADPAARAQAGQAAREIGQQAVRGGALGAYGAVLALILGAGAACWGGIIGRQRFFAAEPYRREFMAMSRG